MSVIAECVREYRDVPQITRIDRFVRSNMFHLTGSNMTLITTTLLATEDSPCAI